MVSRKKWKFINNFIRFIINYKFHIVPFWVIFFVFVFLSASLEEIKLVAIINWSFHVLDFRRLIVISLKEGLVSLRYSLTDSSKITNSYWLVMIFFLLLINSFNISNYSISYCFIFFLTEDFLGPRRQFQQIYWLQNPPRHISPRHLNRVSLRLHV